MLTISREAIVKVANHAWNVNPFEGFGLLLGRGPEVVSVALPVAKTLSWSDAGKDDVWPVIERAYGVAEPLAREHGLTILGLYSTADLMGLLEEPLFPRLPTLRYSIVYLTLCCKSCAWYNIRTADNRQLEWGDWVVPPGVRESPTLNQKRLLRQWRSLWGPIDYSNGLYEERPGAHGAFAPRDADRPLLAAAVRFGWWMYRFEGIQKRERKALKKMALALEGLPSPPPLGVCGLFSLYVSADDTSRTWEVKVDRDFIEIGYRLREGFEDRDTWTWRLFRGVASTESLDGAASWIAEVAGRMANPGSIDRFSLNAYLLRRPGLL